MMFFALGLLSSLSFASIPEYFLIAARTADLHGNGAYQIEQEVTFRKNTEVQKVKETWIVLNENTMRVNLEGRGPLKGLVNGTLVYDGTRREFVDEDGRPKTQRLGEEWLEPLFHFRNGKYLRQRLVQLKVAPQESLNDRSPLNASGPPRYSPPGFIRLSRAGGGVAWAISTGPEAPTLWIEQDQFVIRKYKGASGVRLSADSYAKYDKSKPTAPNPLGVLWYPGTRTYTFGPYVVDVKTLLVKPLGRLKGDDKRFSAKLLSPAKDALKLPDTESVREFYSRFR